MLSSKRLQEVGLQVENVERDAMELWTAAPIESEDKDTECRAAIKIQNQMKKTLMLASMSV